MIKCINCKKEFTESDSIGTKNRNHCPYCLTSLHLDDKKPGDRESKCKGLMKPIALTFKDPKNSKYSKEEYGELMIVHQCTLCGKMSKNRVAGDDDPETVLEVLSNSQSPVGINIAKESDREEIKRQLLGE